MSERPALAIFVKTPGFSTIKTRLAADVGQEAAEEFYRLSVAAIEAVTQEAVARFGIDAVWAVAEPEALEHARWQSFARIAQGTGNLGERLDRVYRELLEERSAVLLLGSDAPLVTPNLIAGAIAAIGRPESPFAISRSADGGYALFAGSRPVPRGVWLDVPYSSNRTAEAFTRGLQSSGSVTELAPLDDFDTAADLARLADVDTEELHPAQMDVVSLARELVGDMPAG